MKRRLDQLVLDRGLAPSREKAQALILAGVVFVNGQKAAKAGQAVSEDCSIEIAERPKFVGRGGIKLERALEHFQIDVTGKVCLDVGASTGGFTDCLLQRGAARVYAVDVGRGQFDWKLRHDPRVLVREGVNARNLDATVVGEPVDFACCDVSFISATLILPAIVGLLAPGGSMVVLVKPQFEAGRQQVGKGGIVRDPAVHEAVCRKLDAAARTAGFETAMIESPISGADGNREFLLYAWLH
jgi:23S rRNA (cytidine1920-2'-O)/16S rRNA (cytidine1409-2'-O)-methyltransferase